MARVSTYMNFMGTTEEAFEFYRKVFGTDFSGPIQRMGDVPTDPDSPPLSGLSYFFSARGQRLTESKPSWSAGSGGCGEDVEQDVGEFLGLQRR